MDITQAWRPHLNVQLLWGGASNGTQKTIEITLHDRGGNILPASPSTGRDLLLAGGLLKPIKKTGEWFFPLPRFRLPVFPNYPAIRFTTVWRSVLAVTMDLEFAW